ncbi:uncharacterized protein LOC132723896 [Ruditapes philippinarum]|uniref:uncharacterized protein LOC132723896 n=1 Tax=Ruditapes philippinarum TaxID=129788 RepID=UPI00295A6C6F|nr:uncharacterized protein LOC132723896 [Ruditapes philippinarum]
MQDYREDEEPVRSSRSMPVPEHLQKRPPTDIEAPPPSYDEAVAPPTATARRAEAEEDSLTPDEIAVIMRSREDVNTAGVHDTSAASGGTEEYLSPDQQDMYNQRQQDRNNYLPSAERRQSFEEAMEMTSRHMLELPKNGERVAPPEVTPPAAEFEPMEIEEGRHREEYTCSGWGPLDEPNDKNSAVSYTTTVSKSSDLVLRPQLSS